MHATLTYKEGHCLHILALASVDSPLLLYDICCVCFWNNAQIVGCAVVMDLLKSPSTEQSSIVTQSYNSSTECMPLQSISFHGSKSKFW